MPLGIRDEIGEPPWFSEKSTKSRQSIASDNWDRRHNVLALISTTVANKDRQTRTTPRSVYLVVGFTTCERDNDRPTSSFLRSDWAKRTQISNNESLFRFLFESFHIQMKAQKSSSIETRVTFQMTAMRIFVIEKLCDRTRALRRHKSSAHNNGLDFTSDFIVQLR